MKVFFAAMIALFMIPAALGNVVISEVMYNPSPWSDTDLEWIELANIGSDPVDLAGWKMDGSSFDPVVLQPAQRVVVARELLDGADEDNESFELVYGDGNNIWDESFLAVKGSFSLTDGDTIILENALGVVDVLNYSAEWGGKGNGYSIYKTNLSAENSVAVWEEHPLVGGSPGASDDSLVRVGFVIVDSVLQLVNITGDDDLPQEGIQIIPLPGVAREIVIEGVVEASQTIAGSVQFMNESYPLIVNGSVVSAKIPIPSATPPGSYPVDIAVMQGEEQVTETISLQVMELVALSLSANTLDFGTLHESEASLPKEILVKNLGNVHVSARLAASSFAGNGSLPSSVLEVVQENTTLPLSEAMTLSLNVVPDASAPIVFRAVIPSDVAPGEYVGAVSVVGQK